MHPDEPSTHVPSGGQPPPETPQSAAGPPSPPPWSVAPPSPDSPANVLGTLAWLSGVASGLLTTIGIVGGLVAAAVLNLIWYTGVAFPLLLALIFGCAAMILGSMGMRRVSSGYASNRGAALAGIVLGVVTTGFVLLAGFTFVALVALDAA